MPSTTSSPEKILLEDEPRFVLEEEAGRVGVGYVQAMENVKRLWPLAQKYWFDALLVAGLGLALAVAVVDLHKEKGPGPRGPLWFDVLATFAFFVPLFWRRRFPFGAPATAAVAVAASSFVDDRLAPADFVIFLGAMAVAFLFGMLRERTQAVAGLAILLGTNAIVSHNDPKGKAGDFIWGCMVFGVVWLVGFGLGQKFREADEAKERADRAEREREERARLAVAEERTRIARELHDIVGHSVSVMTVQASAVRRLLLPEQEREREALVIVEQTGREALAEMRRLVGVLRRPEEAPALAPQPSLEHLDRLVEQVREAGLRVDLRVEGTPSQVPPGVDLTGYRVVQEGLTNALKHAGAHGAQVLVRYLDGEVEIVVSDDGDGTGDGGGSGHGLVGMRERVSVYGGELDAGPRAEGGYALRARLPLGNGHD